jgi:Glycosyltransferase family 10 (fucosyltransferase) C-term
MVISRLPVHQYILVKNLWSGFTKLRGLDCENCLAKIKFRYFWSDFNEAENIFSFLLTDDVIGKFDRVEIHSVFTSPRRLYKMYIFIAVRYLRIFNFIIRRKSLYIWYSGEWIRPATGYDLTLSYWPNSDKNIYWPLWVTNIDFFGNSEREFSYTQDDLVKREEQIDFDLRQNRICTFISNPTSWRLNLARNLENAGLLDIYGTAVGKPVRSKKEIASKYRYQLCFENLIADGYVTEKPFEAYLSGNIPIYASGDTNEYLNEASIIRIGTEDFDRLLSLIKLLIENPLSIKAKVSEPILLKSFDLRKLQVAISKIA